MEASSAVTNRLRKSAGTNEIAASQSTGCSLGARSAMVTAGGR